MRLQEAISSTSKPLKQLLSRALESGSAEIVPPRVFQANFPRLMLSLVFVGLYLKRHRAGVCRKAHYRVTDKEAFWRATAAG